jgi:hypothetical protein
VILLPLCQTIRSRTTTPTSVDPTISGNQHGHSLAVCDSARQRCRIGFLRAPGDGVGSRSVVTVTDMMPRLLVAVAYETSFRWTDLPKTDVGN